MEKTLVIAKPDALQRGLVGEILRRLENKGLKLIGLKMINLNSDLLQEHYQEHLEKPFYVGLEEFMKSSPVILVAVEGYECVNSVRVLVGETNPRKAEAGTIRGDLSTGTGRNLIHASDSPAKGESEVKRFFKQEELFDYDKSEYMHVYESHERK